jgi:hypothetical protein
VKLVGRGDDATLQLPSIYFSDSSIRPVRDVLVCHTTMRYICDR